MVPISKAKINHLMDSPPNKKRLKSIKMMVKELFNDLPKVSVMAWLTTVVNFN